MRTLLRKLTTKSRFTFGKYHDLTVQSLINSKGYKGLDYITWAYYSCSKITFMPEILKMCGIVEENQIDKPGKVKDKLIRSQYIKKAMKVRMLSEDKQDASNQRKSNSLVAAARALGDISSRVSINQKHSRKSILQAKNHGNY